MLLGQLMPGVFAAISAMEVAKVNLPVAVLIWLMIIPMLVKIDFSALGQVTKHWRGIGITLVVNWAIKPFTMALLGWFFIGWLFRPLLPADQIDSYIAGLILLGAAPCTAMVFVWSNLTRGRAAFHAEPGGPQRCRHDRGLRAHRGAAAGPLRHHRAVGDAAALGGALHRRARHHLAGDPQEPAWQRGGLEGFLKAIGPVSLLALLATLVLLFAFQGEQIIAQPLVIALLAVPIAIQTYAIFGIGYLLEPLRWRGSIASARPPP